MNRKSSRQAVLKERRRVVAASVEIEQAVG